MNNTTVWSAVIPVLVDYEVYTVATWRYVDVDGDNIKVDLKIIRHEV